MAPIEQYLQAAPWSYGWKSNHKYPYGHWNIDITKTAITNSVDVRNKLPEPFVPAWDKINTEIFLDKAILTRCYSNRHTFGTEGYIHTDTERAEDYTAIIYMNKEWDANWGGETTFYNKEITGIIDAVLPSYARLVVFPGDVPHCARAVSRICPQVRTTLMFKASVNPKPMHQDESKLGQFLLDVGADKYKHKDGTLKDHLMRTFHALKSLKISHEICLAGGLHSVFGTAKYAQTPLPWESTWVADAFGAEVDRLVRMFCKLPRPECLESGETDSTLDPTDLFAMKCIEVMNLYDQGALSGYPKLQEFNRTVLSKIRK